MKISSSRLLTSFVIAGLLSGCLQSRKQLKTEGQGEGFSDSYYANPSAPGLKTDPKGKGTQLPQPKKRVAVFKFWNDTPLKDDALGAHAMEDLVEGLRKLGKEKLVLPEEIQGILDTKDFVNGDSIKVSQLVKEGRRIGSNLIVLGKLTRASFRQKGEDVGILRQAQSVAVAELELKVFDVTQGREILSTGRASQAESSSLYAVEGSVQSNSYKTELTLNAIHNALGPLVPQILRAVDKLSWEGRIVKSAGNKFYINAGKISGIVPGDILKVLTSGEDIYDPTTGAFLGRSEGRWKGTLEVLEHVGPDASVTRLHTGGQFVEGDIIRLY